MKPVRFLQGNLFCLPTLHEVLFGRKSLCTAYSKRLGGYAPPPKGWNIYIIYLEFFCKGDLHFYPHVLDKESACNAGDTRDTGSVAELGRFPGGGNGNLLWYFCLENPMDRGVWQTTVHRVAKSQTQLNMQTCLLPSAHVLLYSVFYFLYFG